MPEPTMDNKVIFQQNSPDGMEEVIHFDKEGFHYRGQFIADAGEAHRLMVEFLRQQTEPKPSSLKQQALARVTELESDEPRYRTGLAEIRRALEALPND
jgi:hypothetical protein